MVVGVAGLEAEGEDFLCQILQRGEQRPVSVMVSSVTACTPTCLESCGQYMTA